MSLESLLKSPHIFLKMTFPPVMLELMREAVKPEVDFDRIAGTIGMDPVLTATVLSLANSAFYGLPKKVTDLHRAALVLGSREILKIAISVSYQRAVRDQGVGGKYDFFQDWRLTVWSSIAAELLANRLCPAQANQAYLCSLLKDVSLLFLSCGAPEELPHPPGKKHLLDWTPGQLEQEEATWGMHHGGLSQLILSRWGIPAATCDCIRGHHNLAGVGDLDPLTQALVLSTRWAEMELGFAGAFSVVQFEVMVRNLLRITDQEMDDLRRECADKFSAMLQTLGMDENRAASFYQHSLQLMQNFYFLSLDVSTAEGGAPAVAQAVGRHLRLNWDLECWELALRSPRGDGYHLFRHDRDKGPLEALPPVLPADLDWTIRKKGLRIVSPERTWGELRYDRFTPGEEDRERLALYLRFLAQAYAHYCGRQAVLEEKAAVLDRLPVGVARLDGQGRLAESNRLFQRVAGLGPGDEGRDLSTLLRDRLSITLGQEWREFLASPARLVFSIIVCASCRPTGGEPRPCQEAGADGPAGADALPQAPRETGFYFSARRDKDLSPDGILVLLEDITEISQLELTALRQRDFLVQLVGAMRDLVLTTDRQGLVRFVSQAGFENLAGASLFENSKPVSMPPGQWRAEYLASSRGPVEVLLASKTRGERPFELMFSRLEGQGPERTGYLVVGRDLTTIRRLEEHLRRQASHDELTSLYNRHQFRAMLTRELGRARRTNRPMGVAFFDLDGLKAVNDTQGHQAGDAVLRLTGAVLNKEVRDGTDYPCRYGGDEFALIATETDGPGLEGLAERIRQAVTEQFDGRVTISAGLAMLGPEDTQDTVLSRADQGLYKAKGRGGNAVVWG